MQQMPGRDAYLDGLRQRKKDDGYKSPHSISSCWRLFCFKSFSDD